MSVTVEEMEYPTRALRKVDQKQTKTFLETIGLSQVLNTNKFDKDWQFKNADHGDIFVITMELECVVFQQNIFTEESKDLIAKLERIGFSILTTFPNDSLFNKFTTTYYDEKHNLAISLYKPNIKSAIIAAQKIVAKSRIDSYAGMVVFLSTIDVLTQK